VPGRSLVELLRGAARPGDRPTATGDRSDSWASGLRQFVTQLVGQLALDEHLRRDGIGRDDVADQL
jgi:hypothetical protein